MGQQFDVALPLCGGAAGAVFDPDRRYRYQLWREWNEHAGNVLWIMLNPSTADESVLDPTIRRCIAFTKEWGYGRCDVVNLFALRSTDPWALQKHEDPIGPDNNCYIERGIWSASLIVAAWGAHGQLYDRADDVIKAGRHLGKVFKCFGLTKNGMPKHPLYVKGTTPLVDLTM